MHQPSQILALTPEDTCLRSRSTEVYRCTSLFVIWSFNRETIHSQKHYHTLMGFNN